MNAKSGIVVSLFFIFFSFRAIGQDEFFHELSLEKVLIENEKWELTGELNWKRLYNEPRWRRWGLSLFGVRRIQKFNLLGGFNGYYTFNNNFTNFLEYRPWAAVRYNIPLPANIALRQRLKGEWRFFQEEGEDQRQDYRRLRYQLGLDIPLSAGEEEPIWRVRPHIEWYFIRDPAAFERFPNERDYGFSLIRLLENEHEFSFGYRLETFYNTETERENGHLFILGYTL